jgi:autophagy-related protein 13
MRLLPGYRLSRRLRSRNTGGLRVGIQLWPAFDHSATDQGLGEAWKTMEEDVIGLETPLQTLGSTEALSSEDKPGRETLPHIDLFGMQYSLSCEYRSDVDFHVEDLESVLSEKFTDMDEDWFTPTVARHRLEREARTTSIPQPDREIRKVSAPATIPSTISPIPLRQQAATAGSFGSAAGSASRVSVMRQTSSGQPGSLGKDRSGSTSVDKWASLAQDMPFASKPSSDNARVVKVCS